MVANAPVVPLLENFGEVSVLRGMEEVLIVGLTENLEELFSTFEDGCQSSDRSRNDRAVGRLNSMS